MRCVEIQDFCGIALLERLDERFGVAHVLTDRFAVIVVVRQGGVDIRQRDTLSSALHEGMITLLVCLSSYVLFSFLPNDETTPA